MTILGVDCSSDLMSLGLVESSKVLGSISFHSRRRHLSKLIPWIEMLISESEISKEKIKAIACVIGPGSFTGLRIGITTMQGLALAWNIPVLQIYSLDVLAKNILHENVCICMHSRKDQFFCGFYENKVRKGEIQVKSEAEILSSLPKNSIIASPSPEKLQEIQKQAMIYKVQASGVDVALLGETYLEQGKITNPLNLKPEYLANSYAEVKKNDPKDS